MGCSEKTFPKTFSAFMWFSRAFKILTYEDLPQPFSPYITVSPFSKFNVASEESAPTPVTFEIDLSITGGLLSFDEIHRNILEQ